MSPHEGGLVSVLSVPLKGPFAETSFYPLDATSLRDEYQERWAIAEYDALQDPLQAEQIAYLDAFVSVLVTLPYDEADGGLVGSESKSCDKVVSRSGHPPTKIILILDVSAAVSR
jgi:hypothetical protein